MTGLIKLVISSKQEVILRNIISLQIQWPLVQGDVESSQLQRIFQHCDQVGTGQSQLELVLVLVLGSGHWAVPAGTG